MSAKNPDRYVKVFIGRFQPFHNGHLKVLRAAIDTSNLVVVVIGSAQEFLTLKNPWSVLARRTMILGALTPNERKKVRIVAQEDDVGSDAAWVAAVKEKVHHQAMDVFGPTANSKYTLVGCYKGADTYYLQLYKGWNLDLIPQNEALNATDIRNSLLNGRWRYNGSTLPRWASNLPGSTYSYIAAWIHMNHLNYKCLVEDHKLKRSR